VTGDCFHVVCRHSWYSGDLAGSSVAQPVYVVGLSADLCANCHDIFPCQLIADLEPIVLRDDEWTEVRRSFQNSSQMLRQGDMELGLGFPLGKGECIVVQIGPAQGKHIANALPCANEQLENQESAVSRSGTKCFGYFGRPWTAHSPSRLQTANAFHRIGS